MAEIKDLVNSINKLIKKMDSDQDGTQRTPSTAAYNPSLSNKENFDIINRLSEAEENLYKKRDLEREKEVANLGRMKENLRTYEQLLLSLERGTEAYEEQLKTINEFNKKIEERTAKLDDEAESMQAGADVARDLAGAFGLVNAKGTLLGKVFKSLSTSAGRAEFGKNLSENFSAGNLAASSAVKTVELFGLTAVSAFGNVEEAAASYNLQTGLLDTGIRGFIEERGLANFNALKGGFGDITDALQSFNESSLMTNSSFQAISTEAVDTAALMKNFGVSTQDTASNMDILIRSLGFTAREALDTTKEIAQLGIELKIGAAAATKAFAASLPRLSLYGKSAQSIFNQVLTTVSRLGLEVQDALDLSEQFQTFESSATAAGRLNAVLGGPFVDNMQLLKASFEDPAEAINLVRDGIIASGKQAELLSSGPGLKFLSSVLNMTPDKVRKLFQEVDQVGIFGDETVTGQLDANTIAQNSFTTLDFISKTLQTEVMGVLSKLFGTTAEATGYLRQLTDSFGILGPVVTLLSLFPMGRGIFGAMKFLKPLAETATRAQKIGRVATAATVGTATATALGIAATPSSASTTMPTTPAAAAAQQTTTGGSAPSMSATNKRLDTLIHLMEQQPRKQAKELANKLAGQ